MKIYNLKVVLLVMVALLFSGCAKPIQSKFDTSKASKMSKSKALSILKNSPVADCLHQFDSKVTMNISGITHNGASKKKLGSGTKFKWDKVTFISLNDNDARIYILSRFPHSVDYYTGIVMATDNFC
jgi:hypothetical protein